MDKTEFIQLHDFERHEEVDPDTLLQSIANGENPNGNHHAPQETRNDDHDDLLASLGL